MLHVQNLSLGYAEITIVHQANLTLEKGEIGCLLGPSGCGKTTLLRAIAGFERARTGQIHMNERLLSDAEHGTHVPTQQRDIGMVFQDHALFPHLRVGDNVAFGLHGQTQDQKRTRVQEMLELVGLEGMAQRWPHELSGGQQQRVALARALAPAPKVLLMDEPFSSLDTTMRESLAHEVRSILKRSHTTALMVTHDQTEAFAIADQIGVMAQGRLMQWDHAEEIYTRPATRAVAEFVGDGSFLNATQQAQGWHCAVGILPKEHPHYPHTEHADATQVLLRPEHLTLQAQQTTSHGSWAHIEQTLFRGSHFAHTLRLEDGQIVLAHGPLNQPHQEGNRIWVSVA